MLLLDRRTVKVKKTRHKITTFNHQVQVDLVSRAVNSS